MDKNIQIALTHAGLGQRTSVIGLPDLKNIEQNKGVHRVTAQSEQGRRLAAATSRLPITGFNTEEQKQWNARIEFEKQQKKAMKKHGKV